MVKGHIQRKKILKKLKIDPFNRKKLNIKKKIKSLYFLMVKGQKGKKNKKCR